MLSFYVKEKLRKNHYQLQFPVTCMYVPVYTDKTKPALSTYLK